MRRGAKILLVCVLAGSFLTGCWDRRDLENRTSVIAIAIDRNEEIPELVDVTIQIPIPIKIVGAGGGGSTGEGGQDAVKVLSGSGRTLNEAVQNIQKRLNQQLFYGHTRVIVMSETVAETDISNLIDVVRRSPQVRRLQWPIVVQGRASKILEVDPKLEQIPMMFIKEMIESGTRQGTIPDISLGEMFIALSDTSVQPLLNYIKLTDHGVRWAGAAVFLGSKMVGKMTEPHVWALMNLREAKRGGDVLVPCPDDPTRFMTFHPRNVSTKVKIEHHGQIHATYHVRVEGDIQESECNLDFNNEAVINRVQAATQKVLEQRANGMIDFLQNNVRSDVLGLGFQVRAHHPEIWRQVDWDKEFPTVRIDVKYHVNLRRFGMSMGKPR
ncbi:Ger(x)C family spore germination protein [Effusibacillus pohliae]|uniref:Ger(x)C family spore germination protein n=1 Tax=Effusibacillus pohliae TaxID=232270 RepID=UPI00037D61DE|nr:Ger(x)C family spore germination protein [Effusibacillus pohliae]